MSKLRSRSTSRLKAAGIAGIGITSLLLAGTALPAFAAVAGTLSATSGPSGGGNTLTMTTSSTSSAGVFTTSSPYVEFQAVTNAGAGCSTFWKAATAITAGTTTPYTSTAGIIALPAGGTTGGATRLTTNKLVIPVPSGVALAGSQTTSKFYVCVYDSNSTTASTLLANATYSIAAQPTLNAIANGQSADGISPTSGPALGGTTLTITGTGFISGATTVTVGGTPATGVTVNTAGTIVTAVTPSHAPSGPLQVAISTTGGTVTNSAVGGPSVTPAVAIAGFSYTNAVVISPNTAPTGTMPTIDVLGAGFSTLTWGSAITSTPAAGTGVARIVLTDNNWYNSQSGTGSGHFGHATVGGSLAASTSTIPVAQCGSVLPISDGEVICTLDLTSTITGAGSGPYTLAVPASPSSTTYVPNGTYQLTVVNSDAASALLSASYNYSVQSSGSTFTVSPF